MIKKIILLIILIFIFMIIQNITLSFLNNHKNKYNKTYFVENCNNIQKSCILPNGDIIYINQAIKLNKPFDMKIKTNKINNNIYIYFSMKKMNMGFNKYNLNYDLKNNIWFAKNIILPICTHNRNDYILNLIIDNEINYQIPFEIIQ